MLGIIAIVIVLPALVLLFYNVIERFHHKRLVPNFSKLNRFILKHRKAVVIIFAILMIPSVFGAMNVKKYYNMDRAFPQYLGSISALNKLKDDLDMASTHFVIVDKSVSQSNVSKMVSEFEKLDGNKELIDAISSLTQSDLTNILAEIASGMDSAGVEKMFDKYSSLLDNTDDLVENTKAWLGFGEEYRLYTDAADNAETSVIFIYKTDAVKKVQEVSSEKAEDELPWYKKLFLHD